MELLKVTRSPGITSLLPASSCCNIRRSCVCKFGEFNAYLILTSWSWKHRIDTINIFYTECYLIWSLTLQFAKHFFVLNTIWFHLYFTDALICLKSFLNKLPFSFVNSDFIKVELFSSSFTFFRRFLFFIFYFIFIAINCHFHEG